MSPNNPPDPEPTGFTRRNFLASAAVTAAAALPVPADAAEKKTDATAPARKKTFLVVEGHLDDAEIGAGGVLIQAAKAGHRVVIVTVASDYSSWNATLGREERVKQQQMELAKVFGFEKRFIDGRYHQSNAADLEFKRKLAEIYVELNPDVAFISHTEDHWPDHRESGLAAKDAFLFSHGLSHELKPLRVPLILAFSVTPVQTYHFEPDAFYDVTNVMPEYMDLVGRIEAIRTGRTLKEEIKYEFRTLIRGGQTLPLTAHGAIRLADALRWGNMAGCPFAIGFKTVWSERRGPQLF